MIIMTITIYDVDVDEGVKYNVEPRTGRTEKVREWYRYATGRREGREPISDEGGWGGS
jgi:hypothetical protein